ncbi:hypothetical protein IAE39_000012 [Pseudomonas sp. S37]|nr:hypothetical protein [Pseudomonas sp. S36]MBK4991838.1 hypothetical protein [Pseudomonas sp. S37]
MRVPIFEADMLRNGAFKRAAKRIQQHWPGADQLGLMEAHEILAKGLGYQDCHDLQRSVLPTADDVPAQCPPLSDVRGRILIAISGHPTGARALRAEMNALVASLLLQRLQTYLQRDLGQATQVKAPQIPAMSTNAYRHHSSTPEAITSRRILTLQELARLREVVEENGRLRDQCAWRLLLEGLRASEILSARAANPIVVHMSKTVAQPLQPMSLSPALVKSLTQLVQKEGIKTGEYIFKNSRGDGRLSMATLASLFQSTLSKAGLEGSIGMHGVRRSVLFHRSQTLPDPSH